VTGAVTAIVADVAGDIAEAAGNPSFGVERVSQLSDIAVFAGVSHLL
jgi:hypothetical protein